MAEEDLGGRALLILFDTDVLIELRRRDPVALTWFSSLSEIPRVPGTAALEFVIGSRDGSELQRSERFLTKFEVVWPDHDGHALAYELILGYKLSTGIGLADYLIAAQAMRLDATLYTFNLRHFGAINGLDARAPYVR